jgi:hypothetical protein
MNLARTLPLLLVLLASAAYGAGVNLRWERCYGDAGLQNKNFACSSNAGGERLVGSFSLGADLPQVKEVQVKLYLASAGSDLPQWWWFYFPGTCRQPSLSTDLSAPLLVDACTDWTAGQATGGIVIYAIQWHGANTALLILDSSPTAGTEDLVAGQEYYDFTVVINHQKTVGAGSCAGCLTPVCFVLHDVTVMNTPVHSNDVVLSGPANGTDSDWATWQGGGGVVVGGAVGCPAATPTAKRTWGAVKSLYR